MARKKAVLLDKGFEQVTTVLTDGIEDSVDYHIEWQNSNGDKYLVTGKDWLEIMRRAG